MASFITRPGVLSAGASSRVVLNKSELSTAEIPTKWTRIDIVVFLIGGSHIIQFQLVGQLFATDVILLCLAPILILRHGRLLASSLPRNFLVLGLIWLTAQVVTDVVRGTPFQDFARGWARIALTLTAFCSLYLLVNCNPRRLLLYPLGIAVGSVATYLARPSEFALADPWKFGYGYALTLFLLLTAIQVSRARNRTEDGWLGLVLLGAGALNLFMGLRSLGGICALAAVSLIWQRRIGHRYKGHTICRSALTGLFLLLAAFAIVEGYSSLADKGWLGSAAQEKFETQSGGQYSLLLGGRTEALASVAAIIDSPFLGHGSWAKNCEYATLYAQRRQQAGYVAAAELEDCLIPTHSFLLGAWVESGILGALFWGWALTLPIRAISLLGVRPTQLSAFVAFIAFGFIWEILFSPFGADRRFVVAFYAVLMMSSIFQSSAPTPSAPQDRLQRSRKTPYVYPARAAASTT